MKLADLEFKRGYKLERQEVVYYTPKCPHGCMIPITNFSNFEEAYEFMRLHASEQHDESVGNKDYDARSPT